MQGCILNVEFIFLSTYAYFYQLVKKYAFPPLFHPLFNNFFPLHVIWPYYYELLLNFNNLSSNKI